MSRIYLDSSPIIYMVQRVLPYWPGIDARLSVAGLELESSDLTRMECLVFPFRSGNRALEQDFDVYFAMNVSVLVPFTPALFRRAADIRARFNFKTPDALHLVS